MHGYLQLYPLRAHTHTHTHTHTQNVQEILNIYEIEFNKLSDRWFTEDPWPESERVAALDGVGNGMCQLGFCMVQNFAVFADRSVSAKI